MKQVFQYFRRFHTDYGPWGMYLSVLAWCALITTFNYSIDFEDSYVDRLYGSELRTLAFFGVHLVAWLGGYFIIRLWKGPDTKPGLKGWLFLCVGLMVLGWDRSFFYYRYLMDDVPGLAKLFTMRIGHSWSGVVSALLPLALFRYLVDRNASDGLYGFNANGVNLRLYLVLLAMMIPLLALSYTQPDIQEYYPSAKRAGVPQALQVWDIPRWLAYGLYEVGYAFNFVSVELFFRGFLVIGLSRFFGRDVVIPMAVTYCALHFGKPLPETISSIFGGYILGILALYSRNIYGGLFVHVGIALGMELLGIVIVGLPE